MFDDDDDTTAEALSEIASSVRAVAHGGLDGPGGLEGLGMAVAGPHLCLPLSSAVAEGAEAIAEGLQAVAASIDRLADTLVNLGQE